MRNRQSLVVGLCAAALVAAAFSVAGAVADPSEYPPTVLTPAVTTAMQAVHATYVSRWLAAHPDKATWDGYEPISRFGDSITLSNASFHVFLNSSQFWNVTTGLNSEQSTLDWIVGVLPNPCWSWQADGVSASHGNLGGTTSAWPLKTADQNPSGTNLALWLANDNPCVAIIEWGTNDVDPANTIDVNQYKTNMRAVVQACKDNGTIPVLVTIPPRGDKDYNAQTVGTGFGYAPRGTYVQAILDLGTEMSVPVIDYNQQILFAHSADWATTVMNSDGIHPSTAPDPAPGALLFPAWDFGSSNVTQYGYVMRNWLVMHALRNLRMTIPLPDTGGPVNFAVFDTQTTDMASFTQPIRVFPVPAAAKVPGATTTVGGADNNSPNWADAVTQLVYNNFTEIGAFSVGIQPSTNWHWLTMPVGNSNITFHAVNNDIVTPPAIGYGVTLNDPATFVPWYDPTPSVNGVDSNTTDDNTLNPLLPNPCGQYFVTTEGTDGPPTRDKRYPYHVPRLAPYPGQIFLGVLCEMTIPVKQFGIFVPAGGNDWGTIIGQYQDDQNFKKQGRNAYVTVIDDQTPPTITRKMVGLLDSTGGSTYCPFLSITWDGTHRIKFVSIVHNVAETTTTTHTLMDAYAVLPNPPPATPATNPSPANLAKHVATTGTTLSWSNATPGVPFDVWFGTDMTNLSKVSASQLATTYNVGTLALSTTYYWQVVTLSANGPNPSLFWSFRSQPIPGDINFDGTVNVRDLLALVTAWGSAASPPNPFWSADADVNGDGVVNVSDLQLLATHWGQTR